MRKTIKICDKCKREVKWLYDVPYLYIEGLTVAMRVEGDRVQELCKECTKNFLTNIIIIAKNE